MKWMRILGIWAFLVSCLMFNMANPLLAQIELKVELTQEEVYQVLLKPNVTWEGGQGLTATAQVSLLVPTGGFQLGSLQSVNGEWQDNSLIIAPTENPDFDYINVGLVSLGTDQIPYIEGQEVVLFSFVNTGICTGPVSLLELVDPFFPPNSQNINVGNQFTTLGSGNTNAWMNNYDLGQADCSDVVIDNDGDGFTVDVDPDDNDPCVPDNSDSDCIACKVEYKINLEADVFEVSLVSNVNWLEQEGLTSTAQVTLVLPNEGFELGNLESINGTWENNSIVQGPAENPDFSYYTFGLVSLGTNAIPFETGMEAPLFRFTNIGECVSPVLLMENEDPFSAPNSLSINVGNQITTFGSGNINAWCSNIGAAELLCLEEPAPCEQVDELLSCTDPAEPVIVCMDFCSLGEEYELTGFDSQVATSSILLLPNSCIRYTPAPETEPESYDTIAVTACNAMGLCDTISIFMELGICEFANTLVAVDDYVLTGKNQPLLIEVMANDGDTGGSALSLCLQEEDILSDNGSIVVNTDGKSLTYTPNFDFLGVDEFTYSICNESGVVAHARVIVTVSLEGSGTGLFDLNFALRFPTVFSPNHDGINDYFVVGGIESLAQMSGLYEVEFFVMDRWGKPIYESRNFQMELGWDGSTFQSNQPIKEGTYFYSFRILERGEVVWEKISFVELRY